MWIITAAGFDTNGVCYEQRTYLAKMLEQVFEADHFFGIIFTLDEAVRATNMMLVPLGNSLTSASWELATREPRLEHRA